MKLKFAGFLLLLMLFPPSIAKPALALTTTHNYSLKGHSFTIITDNLTGTVTLGTVNFTDCPCQLSFPFTLGSTAEFNVTLDAIYFPTNVTVNGILQPWTVIHNSTNYGASFNYTGSGSFTARVGMDSLPVPVFPSSITLILFLLVPLAFVVGWITRSLRKKITT